MILIDLFFVFLDFSGFPVFLEVGAPYIICISVRIYFRLPCTSSFPVLYGSTSFPALGTAALAAVAAARLQ